MLRKVFHITARQAQRSRFLQKSTHLRFMSARSFSGIDPKDSSGENTKKEQDHIINDTQGDYWQQEKNSDVDHKEYQFHRKEGKISEGSRQNNWKINFV